MKRFFVLTLWMVAQLFADPAIDKAVSELNSYVQIQKSLKVQDPDLSYGMRKALLMAELLFDEEQKLDLDRKEAIKSAFLSEEPQDYEIDMRNVLDQLDASWQPFFDGIVAPADNLILRGLFSTATIDERHAKVAVLAAMLAPYNQGPVGDCFAVSDVIRDHEEYFRRAAADYLSVISNGYVERLVDGTEAHFFFLPILADTDRDQSFNVDFSLFDAPGFAAARTLMGGDQIPDLSDQVMQLLPKTPTPTQVICAMAQVISKNSGPNVDALQAIGEYAFSCLTNNPILRATEAAFAAMAEERPSGSIRQNIHDSLSEALQGVLASNQKFLEIFNQSYRLIYNLDIPLPVPAEDGSSTDGGFQLYSSSSDSIGTRVETPDELRKLVLHALNEAMIEDPKVIEYVDSDDFLKAVLWDYDPANKKEPNPVQNYQKLSRTPMQNCDGDDPYAVDDIDTGTVYENHVQTYTPGHMKDLITWCLGLAKKTPSGLYPMNSPQHAFNFVPGLPEMVAFTKSGMSPNQWLQKNLIIPGVQISAGLSDAALVNKVVQGMINKGLPNTPDLQNLISSFANQKLNVSSLAQKLLAGIVQLYPDQSDLITLIFDTALLNSLSPNAQAILEKSAIRFAFTNWNEGTKDIYFCAYFNPRTQQIAFGSILEDKTNLSPMNELEWVNGQQWNVDVMPAALLAKF